MGGDKVGSRQKHQGETVTKRLKMGETWRVMLVEVPDQLLQDLEVWSYAQSLSPAWLCFLISETRTTPLYRELRG